MLKCPVCESNRIVIVVSPERRGFCSKCGSRWKQQGASRTHIQRGEDHRRVRKTDEANYPA